MNEKFKPDVARAVNPALVSYSIFIIVLFFVVLVFLGNTNYIFYAILCVGFILFLSIIHIVYISVSTKRIEYEISDKFITRNYKLWSENYVDIPVKQITNINYEVDFLWDKFFHTGTIYFYTSGSSFSELSFSNIKNVEKVYENISSLLKLSKSKNIDVSGEFIETKTQISNETSGDFLRRIKPDVKLALVFTFFSMSIPLIFVFFSIIPLLFVSAFLGIIMVLVFAFLILMIYLTYKRYQRIYYDFYTDKVEYYDGFLNLKKSTIPMERITNIDSSQSLFEQIFGVYRIYIETAGSSMPEVTIQYVKNGDEIVNYLKEVLHKHGRN